MSLDCWFSLDNVVTGSLLCYKKVIIDIVNYTLKRLFFITWIFYQTFNNKFHPVAYNHRGNFFILIDNNIYICWVSDKEMELMSQEHSENYL